MIERIYLDNIRAFVNFEWRPGPLAIILGANGSGKTSLFSTLADIQSFVMGEKSTAEAFPAESRTRWDQRLAQTIEIDLRTNGFVCRYRLVIEHDARLPGRNRVKEESVRIDGRPLIEFSLGDLQLYRDDGTKGPLISANATRSGVGALTPSPDAHALAAFKDGVNHLWLLCPDPRAMGARLASTSTLEGQWLKPNLSNFADWYLYALRTKPGTMFKAIGELGTILPGLTELHETMGWLYARFEEEGKTQSFRFDELSDGQRALIALYVLRHVVAVPNRVLAIDEPDNYVALSEIQPWLLQIERAALKSGGPQVFLISHNPEVLNLLAIPHGWRFFRDGLGPIRVERFQPAPGLDAAETIARGWDDEPNG